jgi:hypothetical protein
MVLHRPVELAHDFGKFVVKLPLTRYKMVRRLIFD